MTQDLFGGPHTLTKLNVVQAYLEAYTTVLSRRPHELVYVDAFAGTGYYQTRRNEVEQNSAQGCFLEAEQQFREGSVMRALNCDPPFHRYIFMESNSAKANELQARIATHARGGNAQVWPLDANVGLPNWVSHFQPNARASQRAVCFLDPFGLHLDWSALEVMTRKEGIDIWLLIPSGAMISRSMSEEDRANASSFVAGWDRRLDRFFGTEDWRSELYDTRPVAPLLDDTTELIRRPATDIEGYLLDRLQELFPYTFEDPLRLYDDRNQWLFTLTFAMTSTYQGAQDIAHRIVDHILTNARLDRIQR